MLTQMYAPLHNKKRALASIASRTSKQKKLQGHGDRQGGKLQLLKASQEGTWPLAHGVFGKKSSQRSCRMKA